MQKLIFILLLTMCSLTVYANVRITVSIAPQRYFVQKVAGNRADISVIVPDGLNLYDYEPTQKQMSALGESDIYFTVGDPAERTWLAKNRNIGKTLVVDTDTGIDKLELAGYRKKQQNGSDEDEAQTEGKDPHIWLDPSLVMKQAKAVYEALVYADKPNASFYKANYTQFMKELKALDRNISIILKQAEVRKFMVFHPAWSYFAKRYNLEQVAVELDGKSLKTQEVANVIKTAKEQKLRIIFGLPQFSMKDIKTISEETGARVMIIDPLAENWAEYLTKTAMVIANN